MYYSYSSTALLLPDSVIWTVYTLKNMDMNKMAHTHKNKDASLGN